MRVFLCLPLATRWKYFVLLSPCKNSADFDLWYHLISSSLSNWISLTFKQRRPLHVVVVLCFQLVYPIHLIC
jgi:hypothetical protein